MPKKVLNIAAGKLKPIDPLGKNYFLINLDKMYHEASKQSYIEAVNDERKDEKSSFFGKDCIYRINEDAFSFMETISFKFDEIVCYRFLEHIEKDKVLYFIYLMSTCLEVGGIVDIIVPDYGILASSILSEIPGGTGWEAHDILVTTEMLNFPGDPHASIWTSKRLKYFFELEGRFKVNHIQQNFEFDGRNIYLRMIAERIK